MTTWEAITSLGDSALLLPLIAWMALALMLPPARRHDALCWLLSVAVCGGGVMLSKLLFMAWGIGPPGLDYTGLSGHTALAILVWPALAGLLTRERPTWLRGVAVLLGATIGVGVAVSRLALKVHSPSEVWLGAALGSVTVAWFLQALLRYRAVPDPAAKRRLGWLIAGSLTIVLVCYGRVFPSQHLLQDIALWLNGHRDVFSRRMRPG